MGHIGFTLLAPRTILIAMTNMHQIPLVFARSACEPFLGSFPIPISFKLRRHSHYHPIKVTVEAFLTPYLSPISQKLQTSYELLWIVREKLFRLTRRNMASLHAHRCDTIAFLVFSFSLSLSLSSGNRIRFARSVCYS